LEKPELNVAEFAGGTKNNIILKFAHGSSILYDPDDPCPAKRYKLITKMQYSAENYYMAEAFSSDGIHFSTPQPWQKFHPRADTHNYAFLDPMTGRYILITRIWKDGVRVVAKSESQDFLNWTEPQELVRGIGFSNQIYSMPVFPYEYLYFGVASIYHDGDQCSKDFDTVDLTLLYSTDLEHFEWIEPNGVLIERGKGSYPLVSGIADVSIVVLLWK